MVYVDTSVLVAYYCPEPLSEKAEAFLTEQMQPAISKSEEEIHIYREILKEKQRITEGNNLLNLNQLR